MTPWPAATVAVAILGPLLLISPAFLVGGHPFPPGPRTSVPVPTVSATSNSPAVANFSAAIQRLVELVAFAGAGLLTLVWVRVALSWFSNDVGKKIQAKERARDALIGTLIFVAALSGLVWSLAQWVFTGG